MAMRLPMRRNSRTVRPSDICERRFHGAQQKRARESHALDRLAQDARFERADVGGDVRQFWHAYQLAGWTRGFATSLF